MGSDFPILESLNFVYTIRYVRAVSQSKRLIRLSDLQEIIKFPEAHVLRVIRPLGFQAIPSDETSKLFLIMTSHLRCIDGTNPNLAERLCSTLSTEVEDPYQPCARKSVQ
ncbi:MAG: hypothetical protein K0Q83_1286 [Deltaproteobacteria bacterium]|jgi:hypothetical protein|nr:hypothetical protein [Deltaproteobacteria bacterium]